MYKLNNGYPSVTRMADGVFIPADPNDANYQVYLQWVADGNTPAPADNAAYLAWLAEGHTPEDNKPKSMASGSQG